MAKGRAAAFVAAITKAKDYARKNPEKTSQYIDKVEGFVRGKAGPQHSGTVDKGGDALRKGLGIPPGGRPPGGSSGGGEVPPPPPPGSTGSGA